MKGAVASRFSVAFVAAAVAICPANARADAASPTDEVDPTLQNAQQFELALFAPSAPGFVVLGMSPQRSADPGSFKTFGFDFANLSRGSDFDVGGAFSFEPFWWGHEDLTLKQYEQDTSALERIFARTQVSVAGSFVSIGRLRFYDFGLAAQAQLLDAQDERYDPHSYDCLLHAWQAMRQPAEQAADDAVFDYLTSHPDATQDELTAVRDKALSQTGAASAQAFAAARSACQDAAELTFLSKPSLMMGAGARARTLDTSFTGPSTDGGSIWTTYRQPVAQDGLVSLEFFGAYSFSGTLALLDTSIADAARGNEADVGAGIALERTWWKAAAAATYIAQDARHPPLGTENFYEVSLSGAVRVRNGLWLELSGGDVLGGEKSSQPFFGLDVKYDWSSVLNSL